VDGLIRHEKGYNPIFRMGFGIRDSGFGESPIPNPESLPKSIPTAVVDYVPVFD